MQLALTLLGAVALWITALLWSVLRERLARARRDPDERST